jgi:hypothetical protein
MAYFIDIYVQFLMAKIMLLFERVILVFKRVITPLREGKKADMQDELEIEKGRLKYNMAKDLITSMVNSLPNQDFSDDDIKSMKCIELSEENRKKMEIINKLIGYYPSVSP